MDLNDNNGMGTPKESAYWAISPPACLMWKLLKSAIQTLRLNLAVCLCITKVNSTVHDYCKSIPKIDCRSASSDYVVYYARLCCIPFL